MELKEQIRDLNKSIRKLVMSRNHFGRVDLNKEIDEAYALLNSLEKRLAAEKPTGRRYNGWLLEGRRIVVSADGATK